MAPRLNFDASSPFPLALGGRFLSRRRFVFAQLVDAGCNVIALSRKGAPAKEESWVKSVKWVKGNALVRLLFLFPGTLGLIRTIFIIKQVC